MGVSVILHLTVQKTTLSRPAPVTIISKTNGWEYCSGSYIPGDPRQGTRGYQRSQKIYPTVVATRQSFSAGPPSSGLLSNCS